MRCYASLCFAGIFLFAVIASAVSAVGWTLQAFGIQLTDFQFTVVIVVLWCVVSGIVMWFGMRTAKIKKDMENGRR